jgi:hypothetical protein
MKRLVIAMAMSVWVVSPAATSSADTLIMKDGPRIQGTVVGFAARTVTFRHADGASRRYPAGQIGALEFDAAERANRRAVGMGSFEVPAGTELVMLTKYTIDLRDAGAGQTFSSAVEHDVTNASDRAIVPEKSSAHILPLIALFVVGAVSVAFSLLVFGKLATAPTP